MVVDKTKNFLGVVRTKDIRQLDEKKGLIKDVMHPPILSTNPDTDIVTILKELKTHSTDVYKRQEPPFRPKTKTPAAQISIPAATPAAILFFFAPSVLELSLIHI